MFQRTHFQPIATRINEPRRFIHVLAGPRQVGKTTLIEQILGATASPNLLISADGINNGTVAWLEAQWELARQQWRASGAQDFIFAVDEIQKVPNWSETVKANWDLDTRQKTPIKVILLGSSRLLLQQGLSESLAGRFEQTYMGHWSLPEMESAFGWSAEQYIWFGGYPGAADLINEEYRWKKYVFDALIEPNISRDILSLTRVNKPALLRRLFELGCLYAGQILSFNKMLGQLNDAGNTTTLAHYLDLLDSAGLLGGIQKYAERPLVQRQSSPKFQVHNTALIAAQRSETYAQIIAQPDQWGRMVESSVGAHLLNHSRTEGYELYYWRENNDEVDFVIRHHGKVLALEVKSGPSSAATAGMEAFRKKFKPDKLLLIGPRGLPWEAFLRLNPVDLMNS
jgi:uncharacterized protein